MEYQITIANRIDSEPASKKINWHDFLQDFPIHGSTMMAWPGKPTKTASIGSGKPGLGNRSRNGPREKNEGQFTCEISDPRTGTTQMEQGSQPDLAGVLLNLETVHLSLEWSLKYGIATPQICVYLSKITPFRIWLIHQSQLIGPAGWGGNNAIH